MVAVKCDALLVLSCNKRIKRPSQLVLKHYLITGLDPVKTLEKVFNVDLPDEQINQVIEGIKGQLDPSKLDVSKVGGILNTLKNLLGK